MRWGLSCALFVSALAGCQDALPDRALVDELRVLAVRADPPEAGPGDVVGFDALVADPHGGGRVLTRAWAICTPGVGGVGSCGDPANVLALGTDLRASWTVPASLLDDVPEEQRALGKDLYVVFGVEADGPLSEHDVAFKRLRISTAAEKNANPTVQSFTVAGEASPNAILVPAGADLDLTAAAAAGSMETWSGGVEDARYTWLVSHGGVEEAVSFGDAAGAAQNVWQTPADPKGEPNAWVWVVLRDGRGGIAWAVQPVIFQ